MRSRTIFQSSHQDVFKLSVTILTLGISIITSLSDNKACYIAILIQACSNFYDYAQYLDSKSYDKNVTGSCLFLLITSVIAFVVSIFALTSNESIPAVYVVSSSQSGSLASVKEIQSIYDFLDSLLGKMIFSCMVAFPIFALVTDYRVNRAREYKEGEE